MASWWRQIETRLAGDGLAAGVGEDSDTAAERAVAALGAAPRPIARRDGVPSFGADLVGSISHSGGEALAVAAHRAPDGPRGVGVDLEHGRLSPRAARRIASGAELEWIGHDDLRATVVLSAKESVFKAVCSATGDRPALRDIELRVGDGGAVAARTADDLGALAVRTAVVGPRIVTWAVLLVPPAG